MSVMTDDLTALDSLMGPMVVTLHAEQYRPDGLIPAIWLIDHDAVGLDQLIEPPVLHKEWASWMPQESLTWPQVEAWVRRQGYKAVTAWSLHTQEKYFNNMRCQAEVMAR